MASPTLSSIAWAVKMNCNAAYGALPALIASQQPWGISQGAAVAWGNAAGQIDRVITKAFAITSGTPVTINVNTGLDPSGVAAAMVHLCGFILVNLSNTTGEDMAFTGAGSNPVWGPVPATAYYPAQANGGIALGWCPNPGYTVTPSSADTVEIVIASGTAVAGQIVLFGRSA